MMTPEKLVPGELVLETGERFSGFSGAYQPSFSFGEIVFNTGMVGYVESLTDPSYAGQILVFTYPLIGNYGVSSANAWESSKIHAKGVVMSELVLNYSHQDAQKSLMDWLKEQHIPFLTGVDTRAITRRLRSKGVIPGVISKNVGAPLPSKFEDFGGIHWIKTVSIPKPIVYGSGEKTIIAIDCGMKENILRNLSKFPIRIKRVPYHYDFTEDHFDGVFVSNGPGDPKHCIETIAILQKAMKKQKPIFGICLGTQLMALAVGAKTYKLSFGHRAHNQPCIHVDSQKCYLTSQNHSYAVDEKTLPQDWKVTFRNLNDQSVEGIAHRTLPFFAVQFHPESAPGPMDTEWLFEKFYEKVARSTNESHHEKK